MSRRHYRKGKMPRNSGVRECRSVRTRMKTYAELPDWRLASVTLPAL